MRFRRRNQPGIYVEITIRASLDRLWQLTQDPELHQRWDLRFSRIHYLPRAGPAEPQRFRYETRLGFGLTIRGTGESTGQRARDGGDTTSALAFASEDPKSLIRNGSGYWRYVPVTEGVRFLTWYDYQVRFGLLGRLADRVAFRPLIGWATAWSFDRLRLWADLDRSPEASMELALVYATARITVAFIWVWHGLVPKLFFAHRDERAMLEQAGLSADWIPWIGVAEMLFGALLLISWNRRSLLIVSGLSMVVATIAVALRSPAYFQAAFNPMTLNVAVLALSAAGWIASRNLPSATRCLRRDPRVRP